MVFRHSNKKVTNRMGQHEISKSVSAESERFCRSSLLVDYTVAAEEETLLKQTSHRAGNLLDFPEERLGQTLIGMTTP